MQRIAQVLLRFFLIVTFGASYALAADVEVRNASLRAAEEGLVMDADFELDIGPRLGEAVAIGVPLYFIVEFELRRPRWYWLDEKTATRRMQVRLSYHTLSRQYRLATGLLRQSFSSLEDALRVLRRVRSWLVVDRTTALSDATYDAAVRMRLDITLLPKPFQVSALTNRDWNLESPWKRFVYRAPQQAPAPVETRDPDEAKGK